jgi:putative transposase
VSAALATASTLGVRPTCAALELAPATFYRYRNGPTPALSLARRPPARALALTERQTVLDLLTSERFCDDAPRQIWATLLGQGQYHCSVSTMYRILHREQAVRERRDQLRHPSYSKPELLATAPNQVWSWDITKLLGPAKWTYFYLYVILDIFSRYVVGWMVAPRESATLAGQLIAETCAKQSIAEDQLTLHADRGSSMKSNLVAQLLADLGVTKTHSRPYVSDDNPFSESQFRTMKYRPEFPQRFGSIQDSRSFCGPFFDWYNHAHHHSGIGLHTPYSVHYGLAQAIQLARQKTLLVAQAVHPERFVNKPPALLYYPGRFGSTRPNCRAAHRTLAWLKTQNLGHSGGSKSFAAT